VRFGSVCSGIEAASVAWESLGWAAAWYSEIEPFPCAVLAHHYPNVPNFGDMTKFKEWKLDDTTAIDVLVGGTPCQSFSVAGLRKGLDDPRGNLMLTYLAIAAKYQPKWLVWENVPGVLSSNGGNDFASLLRGVGELGYGFAYRILDSQHFGVPQRRRRVFLVGCLGDWRSAAAVLFERHSLSGNPAPSREKGKEVAGTIAARFGISRNNHEECVVASGKQTIGTLMANAGTKLWLGNQEALTGDYHILHATGAFGKDVSDTVTSKFAKGAELLQQGAQNGGNCVLQPIALAENTIGRQPQNGGNGDGFTVGGPMYTLNATGVHGVAHSIACDVADTLSVGANQTTGFIGDVVAQPYSIMPMNSGKDYKARETDVAQPLMAGGPVGGNQGGDFIVQPIPLDLRNAGRDPEKYDEINRQGVGIGEAGDPAHTLTTACVHGVAQPIAFAQNTRDEVRLINGDGAIVGALAAQPGMKQTSYVAQPMAVAYAFDSLSSNSMKSSNPISGVNEVSVSKTLDTSRGLDPSCNQGGLGLVQSMAVRRLTPVECERLQGFPDNYTNIPWRKKEESPDGPRYKALGNSMAVPVMAWIGQRIQMVEDISK